MKAGVTMWMVKAAHLAPAYGVFYRKQDLLQHIEENFVRKGAPLFWTGRKAVRVRIEEIT